jgi:hypothetical protein
LGMPAGKTGKTCLPTWAFSVMLPLICDVKYEIFLSHRPLSELFIHDQTVHFLIMSITLYILRRSKLFDKNQSLLIDVLNF